jgi:hypothetical protein
VFLLYCPRHRKTPHFFVNPPGPKDALFGVKLYRDNQRDPLGFMQRLSRSYGDVIHFRIGKQEVYLLNHPDPLAS